jgi:hypothetical protein
MRILLFLGLVLNTFLINAQYQLPKLNSDSFIFTDGMGKFVEVDFDCKINCNIKQIELDRIVMRSVKDAMLALKGKKKTFIPKSLTIKENTSQSVFHVSVKYLFEDQKKRTKKGCHYFEIDYRGNFILSKKTNN